MRISITIIIVLTALFSCGYERPVEDKYKDEPSFPDHTNKDYNITALQYRNAMQPFEYGGKLIVLCNDSHDKGQLLILDPDFNVLDIKPSVRVSDENNKSYNTIFEKENAVLLYFTNSASDKVELHCYNAPDWKDNPVELISTDSIYSVLYQQKVDQGLINPNSFNEGISDSIIYTVIGNQYFKDVKLTYYWPWANLTIIQNNQNKFYAIEHYGDNAYLNDLTKQHPRKELNDKALDKSGLNLSLKERIILGNNTKGNHMVFGFYPFGYNYYNITIGDETISFKDEHLDEPIVQVTPFKKRMIIYSTAESKYYEVVAK